MDGLKDITQISNETIKNESQFADKITLEASLICCHVFLAARISLLGYKLLKDSQLIVDD